MIRSQPPRVPQASPRPYSSVPVGSEKPPKGSSYNPPLPPLKISTSNGSPGFDYHQPGDKFDASKVSGSLLVPSPPQRPEVILGKQPLLVTIMLAEQPVKYDRVLLIFLSSVVIN